MRRIVLAVSFVVAPTLVGCASNPTPHPEADSFAGGGPPMADVTDSGRQDPNAGEDGDDALGGDAGPFMPADDASGDVSGDALLDGDVPADGQATPDATPDLAGSDAEAEPDAALSDAEREVEVAGADDALAPPDVTEVGDDGSAPDAAPDVAEPEQDAAPDVVEPEPDTAPDVADAGSDTVGDVGPDVPPDMDYEAIPCTPFGDGCEAGSWCVPDWLEASEGFCVSLEGNEVGEGEACWADPSTDCCGGACEDPAIADCTCVVDPYCCDDWDPVCTQEARAQCGLDCPGGTCDAGLVCTGGSCAPVCDPDDGAGCPSGECGFVDLGGFQLDIGTCTPAPESSCPEGKVPCLEDTACCTAGALAFPNGVESYDLAVGSDGRVHVLFEDGALDPTQLRHAVMGEAGWSETDLGGVEEAFALDAYGDGAVAVVKVVDPEWSAEKGVIGWNSGDGTWHWRDADYAVPVAFLDRRVDVAGTGGGVYGLFRNEDGDYEVWRGVESQEQKAAHVTTNTDARRARIGRSWTGDGHVLAMQRWYTNETYDFEIGGSVPTIGFSKALTGNLGLRFTATDQAHHVFYRTSDWDVAVVRRDLSGYDWETGTLLQYAKLTPWDAAADGDGAWHLCYVESDTLFYQREGGTTVEVAGPAESCKVRTDDQGAAHIVYRTGYGSDAELRYVYRAP
ncbi:MAG: hypothetical protein ACQEXJ_13120 [Myxococcota bacterium]